MSGLLDHTMIRVENLEDWYSTYFEYEGKSRWEADTFTSAKDPSPWAMRPRRACRGLARLLGD